MTLAEMGKIAPTKALKDIPKRTKVSAEGKNQNAQRNETKTNWKRFHVDLEVQRQLALQGDSDAKAVMAKWESCATSPKMKSAKMTMMKAYSKTRSWDFCTVHKTNAWVHSSADATTKRKKTMQELIKKFGKKGAKRYAGSVKRAGGRTRDKHSRTWMYDYESEEEREEVAHRRSSEIAFEAKAKPGARGMPELPAPPPGSSVALGAAHRGPRGMPEQPAPPLLPAIEDKKHDGPPAPVKKAIAPAPVKKAIEKWGEEFVHKVENMPRQEIQLLRRLTDHFNTN